MNPQTPPSLETRIAAAQGGDKESQSYLLVHYQVRLARFVASKMGERLSSQLSVDDMLQIVFMAVFANFPKLKTTSTVGFERWLFRISEHTVIDEARRQSAAKRGGDWRRIAAKSQDQDGNSARALVEDLADCDGDSPSAFVAREESIQAIQIALANLVGDQREAIRLRYFERMQIQEISDCMNKTVPAVRGLIRRAMSVLREDMIKSSMWLSRKGP